jgi:multiple sugar transport system substrate-binding protein
MKRSRVLICKKNLSILLIILILPFVFINCSDSSKVAEKERKISFWHFWSEPNQQTALNSIIDQFEKEYNCKVERTELSWNDGKTKLFAAFNSKTAPDVLELGSDWVAQFSSSGVLQRINSDSIPTSRFVEFSLEPSFWDNTYFAVPWLVDTRVLFYNINLMKKAGLDGEPPISISEMIEFSEKINTLPGVHGFGCNGSDPHRLYKKLLYFFWTFGGGIFNSNGEPIIDSKENISALETYVNISNYGYIETQRQIDALFARGKVGLWISGGWLLEKIKNENPDLDFGVALMPGIDGKPGTSFAGGEYLSISKQSENYELALQFIEYMTKGENSIKFCKKVIEAGFPADIEYYNDPYYQTHEKRKLFSEQLNYARMTPVSPKWLDIEAIIEKAAVEALYGRKSATGALREAQSSVKKMLRK